MALATAGLPDSAYVHVVKEDPKVPSLLYAGTELGLYASYDTGKTWSSLHGKNLPTVAVHDILVHPRENDLILATHGRALWILDDATTGADRAYRRPHEGRACSSRCATGSVTPAR